MKSMSRAENMEALRDAMRDEWAILQRSLEEAAQQHWARQEELFQRCLGGTGPLSGGVSPSPSRKAADEVSSLIDGFDQYRGGGLLSPKLAQASQADADGALVQEAVGTPQALPVSPDPSGSSGIFSSGISPRHSGRASPAGKSGEGGQQITDRNMKAVLAAMNAKAEDTPRKSRNESRRTSPARGDADGLEVLSKSQREIKSEIGTKRATKVEMMQLQVESGSFLSRVFYAHFQTWLEWWFSLEEPPREGLLATIVKSYVFDLVCVCVIMVNCLASWHATDLEVQEWDKDQTGNASTKEVVELCFLIFYTVELLLKLEVHRLYFFCNEDMCWNIFDLVLVGLGIVDQVISFALKGNNSAVKTSFMRLLRILRLARVLRGLRAMRFFDELRLMLRCLMGAVGSLFWSIVMLVFIFYIFGLAMVQGVAGHLIVDGKSMSEETISDTMSTFGSVLKAMLTLYMASTGGNDWSVYYELIQPLGNKVLFLFFVSFIQIALLNILTGIFVENAMKQAQPDREAMALEIRKGVAHDAEELRKVCIHYDLARNGIISREDFTERFDAGKLKAYMSTLGLNFTSSNELFNALLALGDENMDNELTIEEFIHGCLRLKGSASSMDLHLVGMDLSYIAKTQRVILNLLGERLPQLHLLLPTG